MSYRRLLVSLLLAVPLLAAPTAPAVAEDGGGCYLYDPAFRPEMGADPAVYVADQVDPPDPPDPHGAFDPSNLPCPTVGDLTNPANLPDPPMVCTDFETGCDGRYLDPWDSAIPPGTDTAYTTDSFPRDGTRGAFTGVGLTVKDHDGSAMDEDGIVGYGMALPTKDARYRPCDNVQDPYNGACLFPGKGGYLAAKNFFAGGGSNFSAGLFVGNYSRKDTCPSPCNHWWGQRTGRVDVEIYAVAGGHTDIRYVRTRFAQRSEEFTVHANQGTYAQPVGDVRLRLLGDPGVVRLAGIVARAGVRVGTTEAQLRLFEAGSGYTSSNGHGLQAFATAGTNTNGYYDTGALYAGYYDIRAYDKKTGVCRMRPATYLSATGRIDLDLANQADFGHGFNQPC
ncbi:MAG TPA: hypothetical protein VFQ85_10845 [Mycobacteriales bacterium]|jgi:hypothetical protein|nr:hypothetical protein [Mycobacteriales bacterium]